MTQTQVEPTTPTPERPPGNLRGRAPGKIRLPMTPLDAAGEAKVKATLVQYGLLAG